MSAFTIGQLAVAANVPVSTIRFYERTRLFKPDARTGANYRLYTTAALERLRFIRAAQATGFRLDDIRELLQLTRSDAAPCEEVATLTKNRLHDIRARLKELRHVERVLAKSLANCCKGQSPDMCREIIRLKGNLKGANEPCCDDSAKCAQCA